MRYSLLIFISDSKLTAIDVGNDGDLDRVSIEGNDSLEFKDEKSIDKFCKYIKEYYNIDEFSDIDVEVKIYLFDINKGAVYHLFCNLKTAKQCEIIDSKSIIPLLLLKETAIQKDCEYIVESYGKKYKVIVDSDFHCECTLAEKGTANITLEIEKFALLNLFDCKHLISDEKKLHEMENKYKMEVSKNRKSYRQLQNKYETAKNEYSDLKKKFDVYIKEKEELLRTEKINASRTILHFHPDISYSSVSLYDKRFCIKNKCNDGTIIDAGTTIAEITQKGHVYMWEEKYTVKSPISGCVFYIRPDQKYIEDGMDVAIISDKSDTREKVMEWYEKIRNQWRMIR